MELIGICARSQNGVIGHNGGIPWRMPSDLAHFRQTTRGGTVIVGRKTYEGLPPLPNRRVVVVSRHMRVQPGLDVLIAPSPERALALCDWLPRVFVIGGREVFDAFIGRYDKFIVSHILGEVAGDVLFNDDWIVGASKVQQEYRERGPRDEFKWYVMTYHWSE